MIRTILQPEAAMSPAASSARDKSEHQDLLLDEMIAFWRVVQHGGFSQAARACGVEPSSMSRVARLEKALRSKLLVRSYRSLALTELGEQVLRECAQIRSAAITVHGPGDHADGVRVERAFSRDDRAGRDRADEGCAKRRNLWSYCTAVLEEGRIVASGTPLELLARPELRRANLGVDEQTSD